MPASPGRWATGRMDVLVLSLSLSFFAYASATLVNTGFNLLPNPGFESGRYDFSVPGVTVMGSLAGGFSDNTEWAGDEVAITYALDTSGPRSGSRAQCVTVTKGFAQVAYWLDLPVDKSYSLSLWVRVSGAGPVPVELALRKMQADFDMYGTTQQVQVAPADGWVQLSVPAAEVPAPSSGDSVTQQVGFMFWVQGLGTACFDDGALYEMVESPGDDETKLQNADFEGGSYDFNSAPADISGSQAIGGWSDNTDWVTGASLRYRVASDQAQAGRQSVAIQSLSGFVQFVQWKVLPVGTAYRLSIWARAVPAKKKAAAAAAVDGSTAGDGGDDGIAAAAAAAGDEAETAVAAAAAGTAQAAAAGGMSVTLGLRLGPAPYTMFAATSAVVAGRWVQLQVPAAVIPWNVAGTGGQFLDVGFMAQIAGKGTVWLDSASMDLLQALPAVSVPAVPKAKIARTFFGMNINHMHDVGREYDWPAVDFGLWRTWDSGIVWPYIQRDGPDSWDWANTDKEFAQVRARQQRVLFTLGQTPTWASSQPDQPSVYGRGFGSVPANTEHWKRFVRELLKRYGSLIAALEVWNEPNLQGDNGFYNGTPEQLAALALATQQVLQELKHKALLLNPPMGGLAADAADLLLRYFAEAKRLGVVHGGLAFHSYNVPPEGDLQAVAALRAVAARAGLLASLPVFNTEAGILDGDFVLYDNSHAFGGGYLARAFTVNWAAGVSTMYWYAYDADTMEGLTMSTQQQSQPGNLNEAGNAYNLIKTLFTGAKLTSLSRNTAGVWTAALTRGSAASRFWLMWNGDQRVASQQAAVPQGARTQQNLLTGAKSSLRTGQRVLVSDVPVSDVPVVLLA